MCPTHGDAVSAGAEGLVSVVDGLDASIQAAHDLSSKRHILVADLDNRSRSAVEECLSSDQFEIAVFDANKEPALSAPIDLVGFRTADDLEPTRELCSRIRSQVGQDVRLVACTDRNVHPSIRPLLGSDVQSLLIMPFSAGELRQKLNELDLGF